MSFQLTSCRLRDWCCYEIVMSGSASSLMGILYEFVKSTVRVEFGEKRAKLKSPVLSFFFRSNSLKEHKVEMGYMFLIFQPQ